MSSWDRFSSWAWEKPPSEVRRLTLPPQYNDPHPVAPTAADPETLPSSMCVDGFSIGNRRPVLVNLWSELISMNLSVKSTRRGCEMPFPLKCIAWSLLNFVLIAVGAVVAPMFAPRVNPHNDWGATGMIYSFCGAMAGTSSVIVLLLWRSENRTKAGARKEYDELS